MTITPASATENLAAEKATLQQIQNSLKLLARRRFSRWTLGLGANLAAVVANLLSWRSVDQALVPDELVHISPAHYHLFNRLADILLPTEGSELVPAQDIPVAIRVDQLMAGIEPGVRQQLLIGLSLFDDLAVLRFGSVGRFVDLSDADASDYIDNWMNSPIFTLRAVANAAGRLVRTAYWSAPETWSAIGYAGPAASATA